ncbi:MAG: helix-turn-helix domain-containing protein [Rhizobiaceae bacterium]
MSTTISAQTWSLLPTAGRLFFRGFLIAEGRATLGFADDREIEIVAPAVAWIPPGHARRLRLDPGSAGIEVSASEPVVLRTIGDASMPIDLRPLVEAVAIAPAGSFPEAEVRTCFEAIEREMRRAEPGGLSLVSFALGIALLHLWRATGAQRREGQTPSGSDGIVQRFRQLIELHFREGLGVGEYATQLGITRSRLNDVCARVAGTSPLAMVHERVLEEAKRRLEQSSMSIEQIGYALGFRDPAYFNRFFVRNAGTTPGRFRRQTLRAEEARPQSFAAWP